MANENPTLHECVSRFAGSLPAGNHVHVQEALRFARWFGEERKIAEVRASDIDDYVSKNIGSNAPNASARAESLKAFLSYAHKQRLMDEKLVSHVRIRRTGVRKQANNSQALESRPEVHLTAEGLAALQEELEALRARRPKIAQDLRDAMADKDFRENAPLDAAREAQGQLEARIREIENMLRHAVVIDGADAGDAARVGSNVTLSNLSNGSRLSYLLVSSAEARPTAGRLSVASPVGQAIVGKRAGDEIEVQAPSGTVRFRIEKVESQT